MWPQGVGSPDFSLSLPVWELQRSLVSAYRIAQPRSQGKEV